MGGTTDRALLDLRRLRYFVAVCEHGGFSRAAAAIGIAQPALTRQVQRLEQALGLPLVRRTGRGAVPTEAGRALLDGARLHLEALDALADLLRREFGAAPEGLRIGICPTIAPLFLDALRSWFRGREAGRELSVVEAYSGDLSSLLERGHIHAALTYRPLDAEAELAADLLSERLVLVSRAGRTGGGPAQLGDIAAMRLILPSRLHQLRRIVDRVAAARGLALRPDLELNSLAAVKATIDDARGDYATILPTNSVAEDEREGRFAVRPIDDPGMVRTISVVLPPGGPQRLPADLVEHVKRHAEALKRELASVF
jgi:LysR family nitrogen assimilation transcriptional regulator